MRFSGFYGVYWSRSGGNVATDAYYLAVDDLSVTPSYGPRGRYHGFSLRCLQE